mgnify:CR=1 FL=1
MDPRKVIICRCEDITLEDILKAIDEGYNDLESLKRKLRIGMGPCQGSHCIPLVVRILASRTGKKPDEILIPSNRPPLTPISFKYFLKGERVD